jgi:hypothetical protein
VNSDGRAGAVRTAKEETMTIEELHAKQKAAHEKFEEETRGMTPEQLAEYHDRTQVEGYCDAGVLGLTLRADGSVAEVVEIRPPNHEG